MNLPARRPETGPLGLAEDRRALNELIEAVRTLSPRNSPTITSEHTSAGVTWNAVRGPIFMLAVCDETSGDQLLVPIQLAGPAVNLTNPE